MRKIKINNYFSFTIFAFFLFNSIFCKNKPTEPNYGNTPIIINVTDSSIQWDYDCAGVQYMKVYQVTDEYTIELTDTMRFQAKIDSLERLELDTLSMSPEEINIAILMHEIKILEAKKQSLRFKSYISDSSCATGSFPLSQVDTTKCFKIQALFESGDLSPFSNIKCKTSN
jgi:hypothetical protein